MKEEKNKGEIHSKTCFFAFFQKKRIRSTKNGFEAQKAISKQEPTLLKFNKI